MKPLPKAVIGPQAWPKERDDALMELMAEGYSYERAATRLGTTKGAAISRFRKICRHMGWQAS